MRRLRRLVASCVLAAICFVQLATAAHACMAMAMAEPESSCAGMASLAGGEERPTLCLEHCKGHLQLVDNHSPVPACAGPIVAPIVVEAPGDPWSGSAPSRFAPDPAAPLPVFAASSRLRI